jgi:RNA recognition motif-containing protein
LEDGASISSGFGEIVQFEYVNAKKKEEKKKVEVKKEDKVEEKVPEKVDDKKEEPKKKVYVPPSHRGTINVGGGLDTSRPSYRERDDSTTIRISNLADEVTEVELRDMFGKVGMIGRVYLATDKETGLPKGFAFVTYRFEESVDKAIAKFDGKGFHHMILSVERSMKKTI